jgi:hypothetical protein
MYYFNRRPARTRWHSDARAFDTNGNSVTMALSSVSMNAALDPIALQVDLGYGADGSIINSQQRRSRSPRTGSGQLHPAAGVRYGQPARQPDVGLR